jgi:APA family basic amino acid/polyamine antiporter
MSVKRSEGLSIFTAIAFSVGSMVGAGVFVLSGMVVDVAGPSAILSYLLCGITVSFSGLSYAVLASIFPEDGGGYLFTKRMLGKFTGFIAGWAMYIAQPIGASFVLLGLGIYLNLLLGIRIDPRVSAIVAMLLLTVLNIRGLAEAGKLEVGLVITKVIILIVLIVAGLILVQVRSFVPFLVHGTSGVLKGVAMVFFAYMGFQVVAMMGGEIKKSSKNVPLAILVSIGIVIVIYLGVIVALVSAQLQSYGSQSVFDAAVVLLGIYGGMLVSLAAVMSTLSSANASVIGASRIMLEMASEKQIPGWFATLKNNQPINSILLVSGITILLIFCGELDFIVNLTNVTTLITMFLVNGSAFILIRKREHLPLEKSYFKIPLGVLFPTVGAVSCILILITISPTIILLGVCTIFLGSILYLLEDTPRGEKTVDEIRKMLRHPTK